MATLRLYVNLARKALQFSDQSGSAFVLPTFYKYETVPLEITLVEPDPVSQLRYIKPDISNIALSVAINDTLDDGSPLAQQTTWTKDTTARTFTGNLELNTAGFNSFLGSSAEKAAYFEIELTEGTARWKVIVAGITVKNAVQQPATTAPSPVQEYYTKAQLDQMFAKYLNGAGQTFTLRSPSGTFERIIGIGDDGTPLDQIAAV